MPRLFYQLMLTLFPYAFTLSAEIRASVSLSGIFVSHQIPVEEQPENANGLSYTQNTGFVYI